MIFFLLFAALAAALAAGLCLAVLAGLAAAALAGIFSTSVLVAWFQKRPATFLRLLFAQAGGLLGIPLGIVILWLEARLMKPDLPWPWILGGGAAAGCAGGIACGFLASLALERAVRKLLGRT